MHTVKVLPLPSLLLTEIEPPTVKMSTPDVSVFGTAVAVPPAVVVATPERPPKLALRTRW